jgi:hypothetical protein
VLRREAVGSGQVAAKRGNAKDGQRQPAVLPVDEPATEQPLLGSAILTDSGAARSRDLSEAPEIPPLLILHGGDRAC